MPIQPALAFLLILVTAPAALAQTAIRPTREAAASIFTEPAAGPLQTFAVADTVRPLRIGTYAREGAIVGGLLGAVGGGLLAEVACGLSEDPNRTCTGSFLIGGVLGGAFGALPGALIGGLFPKYPRNTRVVDPEGMPDRPNE